MHAHSWPDSFDTFQTAYTFVKFLVNVDFYLYDLEIENHVWTYITLSYMNTSNMHTADNILSNRNLLTKNCNIVLPDEFA